MAETGPKQQDSSAAMAAVNGGRQVARFNVTTPSGVTPSPAGDVDVAPAATPAVDDRDRRDVSPSRFRVEFVAEAAPADDRPMSIGSGSTTAAGHSTYDTQHQKTFGHNTLDALPHADHYRNLLSAVGHIRKRPTLLELHELSVCCSFRLANRPGMAGIVPELTHGVPCPGRGSFCPENVKIDNRT